MHEIPPERPFEVLTDHFTETASLTGKDKLYFVYKVPPLAYAGEDLVVEFKLRVLTNPPPLVRGRMSSVKGKDLTSSNATFHHEVSNTEGYAAAVTVLDDMVLIIDHDEKLC